MHPTRNKPTSIAPACELSRADILRAAAVYIERYGWHQGAFYPEHHLGQFPPACATGALRMAVCGRPVRFLDNLPADEQRLVEAAQRVLAGWLDGDIDPSTDSPTTIITDWNDDDWRTATDVITELRNAADDWDRIHGGTR